MEDAVPQSSQVIAIHSGGLDSTVMIYHLLHGGNTVKSLSVVYGQSHQKEIAAAAAICEVLDIEHRVADLYSLRQLLTGSALTSDEIEVPDGHYEDSNMAITVVPNRNMILLAVAAGWAISNGFEAIAYGAHAGDHTIYPDCRPAFVEAMKGALRLCHTTPISVWTPFIQNTKAQIVAYGSSLGVPFEMTWSCYKGGEKHCGLCGTCVERKEAFVLANIADPTEYEE